MALLTPTASPSRPMILVALRIDIATRQGTAQGLAGAVAAATSAGELGITARGVCGTAGATADTALGSASILLLSRRDRFLLDFLRLVKAPGDFVEPGVWNLVGAVHDASED